jgi:hypothetical protein
LKSIGICKVCGDHLGRDIEDCPKCGCCCTRIHWRVFAAVILATAGVGWVASMIG